MPAYKLTTKGYSGGWSTASTNLKSYKAGSWQLPQNAYYSNGSTWVQFWGSSVDLLTSYTLDVSADINGPVICYISFGGVADFATISSPDQSYAAWLADAADDVDLYEIYIHKDSGDGFDLYTITYDTWLPLSSAVTLGYSRAPGQAMTSGVFTVTIRHKYGTAYSDATTINMSCFNSYTGGK